MADREATVEHRLPGVKNAAQHAAAARVEDSGASLFKPAQPFFEQRYQLGEVVGQGASAKVYSATDKETGQTVAVKLAEKASLSTSGMSAFVREARILSLLDHPHVERLYAAYEDDDHYHLVVEIVNAGELFDRIVAKTVYAEKDARDLVYRLIRVIEYIHSRGVMHRDLKPENLLMVSPDDDVEFKMVDFGFAIEAANNDYAQCGSPSYVAPEILTGAMYDMKVDIWSAGVITYILLCGYPPFFGDDEDQMFSKILNGDYEFHPQWWENISDNAKDLVRKMLEVDPAQRWSAEQLVAHPWFADSDVELSAHDITATTLSNLRKFNARRRLRAGIDAVVALNRFKTFARAGRADASTTGAKASGRV